MMGFIHRLFHRPPKCPPDTPALQSIQRAQHEMRRVDLKITRTVNRLERQHGCSSDPVTQRVRGTARNGVAR